LLRADQTAKRDGVSDVQRISQTLELGFVRRILGGPSHEQLKLRFRRQKLCKRVHREF
jgi:hypothetical protein